MSHDSSSSPPDHFLAALVFFFHYILYLPTYLHLIKTTFCSSPCAHPTRLLPSAPREHSVGDPPLERERDPMSISKNVDEAFHGAGAKPGLEIWCIDNNRLVPIPKPSHGKFFSGSSYIILSTIVLKSGIRQHDIHYWSGKNAKEVDLAVASDKAVELDAALGSCAVQYREVQGYETEKFLSYFKPCILPIEGVFSSELQGAGNESYRISLLACKGDHVVHVREVPFTRSSLNHNEVFILDTQSKIFLFSGSNSTTQERAKALDVVQYIKENHHGGRCEVATIEDGKLVGDSDSGEFWSLFGGYAPITRDSPVANEEEVKVSSANLFWINRRKLFPIDTPAFDKWMLSSDKCYMLDCDTEIFIWMGRTTLITERKASISAVEEIMHSQGRSMNTHTTFLTEGSETAKFKSYFSDWPQNLAPSLYEEGREKVAAIFKHQGFDVKEFPDDISLPIIDCSGILKVWLVNGHDILLIQAMEHGTLYSGDCYIVQYTYPGNDRDNHLFYAWLGRNSILEDRVDAVSRMSNMVDSIKGHAVMAQISEGKEPKLFFTIFQSLIIFKGGMSSGYKTFISEKGSIDETYDTDKTALFRVQGTGPDNMQAIQVDVVSGSLNSSYCYMLQDGASIFTWTGNFSSPSDHDILDRMLVLISPLKQPISIREGSEPDIFWTALGGKSEYPREKDIKDCVEDPHLFTCVFKEGDFKWKEIFNFTQDDLTTEDVLVLDCHNEIYVWVGQHANLTSKEQVFTLGKNFLKTDILLEGLSLDTAINVIQEGSEPSFFTHFFDWDISKSCMHGNSYERKLAILKGLPPKLETPDRGFKNSYGRFSSEYSLDHSMRKSANSDASNRRNWLPAYTHLAGLGTTNSHCSSNPATVASEQFASSFALPHKISPDLHMKSTHLSQVHFSEDESSESQSVIEELKSSLKTVEAMTVDDLEEHEVDNELQTFPYELLKVPSVTPIAGIDVTKREAYLSSEEFQAKFRMTKKAFYKLPKWRQNKLKMDLSLF